MQSTQDGENVVFFDHQDVPAIKLHYGLPGIMSPIVGTGRREVALDVDVGKGVSALRPSAWSRNEAPSLRHAGCWGNWVTGSHER